MPRANVRGGASERRTSKRKRQRFQSYAVRREHAAADAPTLRPRHLLDELAARAEYEPTDTR